MHSIWLIFENFIFLPFSFHSFRNPYNPKYQFSILLIASFNSQNFLPLLSIWIFPRENRWYPHTSPSVWAYWCLVWYPSPHSPRQLLWWAAHSPSNSLCHNPSLKKLSNLRMKIMALWVMCWKSINATPSSVGTISVRALWGVALQSWPLLIGLVHKQVIKQLQPQRQRQAHPQHHNLSPPRHQLWQHPPHHYRIHINTSQVAWRIPQG